MSNDDLHGARFAGTTQVRPAHRFDEAALRAWLADRLGSDGGRFRVTQFRGGQSNPTYRVDTARERLVLRRKPPGTLLASAHAVERECRVMKALQASAVPVPRVLALCEDERVIGTPFYVMEHVEGRVLWDARLPGLGANERERIYAETNRVLAALHDVDIGASGLADFGRPDHYVARQVARWSRQYRASQTETIEAMEWLIEWLPAHLPEARAAALVHGDYRLDNLVFHAHEPRVAAVLDWELSTLGDPIADLAYHCMAWRLPVALRGLGAAGSAELARLGIPDEERYRASYCARRGLAPVAADAWGFYLVFNLFRAAAIAQGILARARAGNASSEHAEQAGRQARLLARLAWQQARARGAGIVARPA